MKSLAISLMCFSAILLLVGCQQFRTKSLQGMEHLNPVMISKNREVLQKMNPSKEDILFAFRFWVNKQAWLYDNFEYVGNEKTVEIYYEEIDEKTDYKGHIGYLYFPFQEKENTRYKKISFFFGEEGFASRSHFEEETEKIDEELIYLGKDTFYFAKDDIAKPEFPPSSKKKNNFIEKAKQVINDSIHSYECGKPEDIIGEYNVYIENCTNQDTYTYVVIVKDNEEVWSFEIHREIWLDDGKISTDVDIFRGTGPLNWSDKRVRRGYEKSMQLSVCEFTVTVS